MPVEIIEQFGTDGISLILLISFFVNVPYFSPLFWLSQQIYCGQTRLNNNPNFSVNTLNHISRVSRIVQYHLKLYSQSIGKAAQMATSKSKNIIWL